jgi:transcriptional regulator with XRE-family HTH domain
MAAKGRGGRKLTQEKILRIRNCYLREKKTQKDLAIEYGVSETMIREIVRGRLWKETPGEISPRFLGRRGERANGAKLTKNQVEEIRKLLRQGLSQRRIAARFGVKHAAIGSISRGTAWKETQNGL